MRPANLVVVEDFAVIDRGEEDREVCVKSYDAVIALTQRNRAMLSSDGVVVAIIGLKRCNNNKNPM